MHITKDSKTNNKNQSCNQCINNAETKRWFLQCDYSNKQFWDSTGCWLPGTAYVVLCDVVMWWACKHGNNVDWQGLEDGKGYRMPRSFCFKCLHGSHNDGELFYYLGVVSKATTKQQSWSDDLILCAIGDVIIRNKLHIMLVNVHFLSCTCLHPNIPFVAPIIIYMMDKYLIPQTGLKKKRIKPFPCPPPLLQSNQKSWLRVKLGSLCKWGVQTFEGPGSPALRR